MKKKKTNQIINKRINAILNLAESIYFDDRKLPLFRRQLLTHLNDLRRDLLQHLDGESSPNNMGDTVVTSYRNQFRRDPLAEGVWHD